MVQNHLKYVSNFFSLDPSISLSPTLPLFPSVSPSPSASPSPTGSPSCQPQHQLVKDGALFALQWQTEPENHHLEITCIPSSFFHYHYQKYKNPIMSSSKKITLESSDHVAFEVDEATALQSEITKQALKLEQETFNSRRLSCRHQQDPRREDYLA